MKENAASFSPKELDVLDWGIRQLRSEGFLGMREMILVLRVLMLAKGRKRRFSDREIRRMCERR